MEVFLKDTHMKKKKKKKLRRFNSEVSDWLPKNHAVKKNKGKPLKIESPESGIPIII